MKKINSNSSEGCQTTSSNCVIWDGPDISCLNICNGDSITDITYKLAQKVCEITQAAGVDVSGVDFTCIIDQGVTDPDTLTSALQLMIQKHCELKLIVDTLDVGSTAEPLYRLPACLEYVDGFGDTIQFLAAQAYSEYVATQLCTTISNLATTDANVATNTSNISALDGRVTALEAADVPETVTFDSCVENTGTQRTLQEAASLLEDKICDLQTATGTPTELVNAVARQCVNLSSLDRLANGTGAMSTIPGWESSPANVADTLNNMWLTVCDIRDRVIELGDCCAPVCDDIVLSFSVSLNVGRTQATLDFTSSTLPVNFVEVPLNNSTVTVSDGSTSHVETLDFTARSVSGTLVIDLAGNGISATDTLVFVASVVAQDATAGVSCTKNTTEINYFNNNTVNYLIKITNNSSIVDGTLTAATFLGDGVTSVNVSQSALLQSSVTGTANISYAIDPSPGGDLYGRLYLDGVQVGNTINVGGTTAGTYAASFAATSTPELELILTDS